MPRLASSVFYAIAHFAKTLLWSFFNTFFIFFAVYGLGLSPLWASVLAFGFALLDLAFDLPAAFLIDRMQLRWRGMARWVLIAAPVCGGALYLSFRLAPSREITGWLAVCVAAGMLFRLAFSFVDVPLNASIGRIAGGSRDRNALVRGRHLASVGAQCLLGLLLALGVEQEGRIDPEKLAWLAGVVALAAPPLLMWGFAHAERQACAAIPDTSSVGRWSWWEIRALCTGNLLRLGLINMLFLLLAGQVGYALIFISRQEAVAQPAFSHLWAGLAVCSALSVWPWMALASKYEKSTVLRFSLLGSGVVILFFPFFRALPLGLVFFVPLFAGVFQVNALIWSMLPDAVDEAAAAVGRPVHAPLVGAFAAVGKLAIGAAQLLGGALLQWHGFPQNPDFAGYESSVALIAAGSCLLALWPLRGYELSHRQHREIIAAHGVSSAKI